jgi:tetratricopeptide (TPR) repeat protein
MRPKLNNWQLSRRDFLAGLGYAPAIFRASPFRGLQRFASTHAARALSLELAEYRLSPSYPAPSPLDDVLRLVAPGSDEFATEKYAAEIGKLLNGWSTALEKAAPAAPVIGKMLSERVECTPLSAAKNVPLRSAYGLEVLRREFKSETLRGRDAFLTEILKFFATFRKVDTAEFQMVGIREVPERPSVLQVQVRYDISGERKDGGREGHIGYWSTQWAYDERNGWQVVRWEASTEAVSRVQQPLFIDMTGVAFGGIESYAQQFAYGVDHWRTVLDAASGIDVYGNNGIAAGDFDGDGFDDLYICQPAGLPNRLYHNRGDGTFEDVTAQAGVDVLDGTACALFADFENKGVQDLLVVSGSGPLLFLNQGNGKFSLKGNAFHFAQPPQGTFTHAAIADYDNDGRLDIYFCLYSYYLGLDQYHYPAPYFDARNGPPNFLMRNEGGATFRDVTQAAGLNVDNDRYSFACAWGDCDSTGRPSLYVANDFGRSNLYRNNGDGTFTSVAPDAGVEDPGAGMSATWCDFDNAGKQDIYVANMWSAAGLRVAEQKQFQADAPETVRGFYRQHAHGNSLYRNLGNGKFQNVSPESGVEMGRWAWCSDAWDFDHDGYSDLYIANGYISGPEEHDLGSFFWRQVVGKSPESALPSSRYEQGWNAINELIRSDSAWSGRERNVLYTNLGDGTFAEVSSIAGMDFLDDSRAFALADLDHDGRLEVILKNRTAPQLRVLRNAMKEIGNCVAFRLRGEKSNHDAIGAAVTVESGTLRQIKYLQAGTGFLSQHSKELFFGLGKNVAPIHVSVRWPSGVTQVFHSLPVNTRFEMREGSQEFAAHPFSRAGASYSRTSPPRVPEGVRNSTESWLIEPLRAPEFSQTDHTGRVFNLRELRGSHALLVFWAAGAPESLRQLQRLERSVANFQSRGLRIIALNIDDATSRPAAQQLISRQNPSFPVLFASSDTAGVYNIFFRYLFDRRRDLPIPVAFLLDREGRIVKLYQGLVETETILGDLAAIPITETQRVQRALPFPGTLYDGKFQRNDFTFGVALFQHGYLDQAAGAFKQVIAAKPTQADAYYNLGTLYLRRNSLDEARTYLEQSVKLRPNYPEAFNNLGMIAAQQNQPDEAVRNFQRSLQLRPDYAIALLNLGNVYRRQDNLSDAAKVLKRALELEPENPEVHYNLGMLYARQEQLPTAARFLEKAVQLRPNYPDALNNLGVFFVREERYTEAEEKFKACIRVAPQFDQAYLNLARLYVILREKAKARQILQALLQQQPQHKMAQQALEMLN